MPRQPADNRICILKKCEFGYVTSASGRILNTDSDMDFEKDVNTDTYTNMVSIRIWISHMDEYFFGYRYLHMDAGTNADIHIWMRLHISV